MRQTIARRYANGERATALAIGYGISERTVQRYYRNYEKERMDAQGGRPRRAA